ncbi:hypothetical protein, partial [Escherichia coli]|uniref:hypothetical protein n=1 Tax=Escherichia coli TaxID=562 RepID=UPI001953B804
SVPLPSHLLEEPPDGQQDGLQCVALLVLHQPETVTELEVEVTELPQHKAAAQVADVAGSMANAMLLH